MKTIFFEMTIDVSDSRTQLRRVSADDSVGSLTMRWYDQDEMAILDGPIEESNGCAM